MHPELIQGRPRPSLLTVGSADVKVGTTIAAKASPVGTKESAWLLASFPHNLAITEVVEFGPSRVQTIAIDHGVMHLSHWIPFIRVPCHPCK